jgi:predicted dehydrogenase
MPEKMKVGVIGCGQIARRAPAVPRELPVFEIGAVWRIATVVEAVGERSGVKAPVPGVEQAGQTGRPEAVLVANKNHAGPAIARWRRGSMSWWRSPSRSI